MIELHELVAAGGELAGTARATSFADWCYDSRLAQPGQCFVALRTERRDGHDFISDAIANGCTGVLCSAPPSDIAVTTVVVPDVRAALQRWAAQRVCHVAPRIVGVTGSVGKSTTKRAIASVLRPLGPVFRTRRSFNSLLGLPLALAELAPEHRWAVLEMGIDRFGEMARLCELFPPTIAVVTNVGPTHLQYLRDEEHIAAEKGALVAALPGDGAAVLNADDPRVRAMASRTAARVVWFGLADHDHAGLCDAMTGRAHAAVWASKVQVSLDGTRFEVQHGAQRILAEIPLTGRHQVYTALAAISVGLAAGLSLVDAAQGLARVERQAGRLNPLPGLHGSTIIDDTYNASPLSLRSALQTLADLPARRRIAVLGPMLELGEATERLHREGEVLAREVCDVVVTVGDVAAQYVSEAPNHDRMICQASNADAAEVVRQMLGPGDLVLVKGSAAARTEQVVAGLLRPAVDAATVLVRQEASWQKLHIAEAQRPTWLEIDLGAIANNVEQVRSLIGSRRQIMAVLKADAYGHGAIHCARTVVRHGATLLAVATLGEAIALRKAAIAAPILILGYTPPWQVRDALRYDIQVTVFDPAVARELSLAAEELQLPARVHVKVDTGMARLGLLPVDCLPFMLLLKDLPGVEVGGVFSHLATADNEDETFAREQIARFDTVVRELEAAGLRPPLVHLANSAAILRFPEAYYDLVRPGLLLYGLEPSPATPRPAGFRPALQFKTAVAQVRTLEPGDPVSYGATWRATRRSKIATLPVGYADGFRRSPAWQAVLVRGQLAPVVGRVCMDYTMIDVTDSPDVKAGDEVVLIGCQGRACLSAEEVADWLGTINYEVIAAILPRVPRVV